MAAKVKRNSRKPPQIINLENVQWPTRSPILNNDQADFNLENSLNLGVSDILKGLQSTEFPNQWWSMVQPYVHMEYIGIFGDLNKLNTKISTLNDEGKTIDLKFTESSIFQG